MTAERINYTPENYTADMKKLETLMGNDWNEMEMRDYFSYVPPGKIRAEIDLFEQKLKRPNQSRKDIIEGFKKHLSYLYAA